MFYLRLDFFVVLLGVYVIAIFAGASRAIAFFSTSAHDFCEGFRRGAALFTEDGDWDIVKGGRDREAKLP
jgi:hypothetical protein